MVMLRLVDRNAAAAAGNDHLAGAVDVAKISLYSLKRDARATALARSWW